MMASASLDTTGYSTTVISSGNITHDDHALPGEEDHAHHGDHDSVLDICISAFIIVISVFICFGNSVTLLALVRSHRLRTIPNMYIGSLAVADLLVGLMLLVQGISRLLFTNNFAQHEEYPCLILMSMLFISVAASMFSVSLVACDRYIYIMHPLKYSRLVTKKKSLRVILITWALAFVYGSVPLYTSHFNVTQGCSPTHTFSHIYMIIVHPIVFFTVCGSAFWLYLRIARTAISQQRKIRDGNLSGPVDNEPTQKRNISKRYWKVVKLLMLVFGLFFLSWCPLLITAILEYTLHVNHHILTVVSLIAIANSGTNFCVLASMNKDFRSEFLCILCVCCDGPCSNCCGRRVPKVHNIIVSTVGVSSVVE